MPDIRQQMLYAPPGEEEAIARLIARVDDWAEGIPRDGLSESEVGLLAGAHDIERDSSCPELLAGEGAEPQITDAISRLREVETRRTLGQFFTPEPVVRTMVEWGGTGGTGPGRGYGLWHRTVRDGRSTRPA